MKSSNDTKRTEKRNSSRVAAEAESREKGQSVHLKGITDTVTIRDETKKTGEVFFHSFVLTISLSSFVLSISDCATETMDEQILHAATSLCFNNLERNPNASVHEDHTAVSTDINGVGHINVKVFYPQVFDQIRQKYHISNGEIVAELQSGPLITSDLAGDFDDESFFTSRERLVVTGIHDDKLSSFRETFQQFSEYQLSRDETFLPVTIGFFQVETRAKMKSKTNYFLVSRSIFPRQGHDYMHFLDLKGCITRTCDGGFLKDGDVTWEHEISFPPSERNNVLEALTSDTNFLQSLNLTNYSLIVVITQRHLTSTKQKPGQPYGPDNDNEEDDRKKTLPLRHDVADGAKPIRADLVPKPRFCDEHPEW